MAAAPAQSQIAVLSNVDCNDNGTTSDASDDFITFDLEPTGSGLGSDYTVSVNSGSVTPTTGSYGSVTSFTLDTGTAGGGDVDVTITDDADNTCTATETITDPGSCSSGGGGSTSTLYNADFSTDGDGFPDHDNDGSTSIVEPEPGPESVGPFGPDHGHFLAVLR